MPKLNILIIDGCMAAVLISIGAITAHLGMTWLAFGLGFTGGLWANDFIRGLIRGTV